MPDLLFSWPVAVVIAVALAALVAVSVLLIPGATRTASARLYCPRATRQVVVQFFTDGREPVSVLSCSAFEDSRAGACWAPCVGGGGRRGTPTREARHPAGAPSA
jgi:hypothetical protein